MMSKVLWRVLLDRLATGIRTPKQVESYIANSPYWFVRYAVAIKMSAAHSTLQRLTTDPIEVVRREATATLSYRSIVEEREKYVTR